MEQNGVIISDMIGIQYHIIPDLSSLSKEIRQEIEGDFAPWSDAARFIDKQVYEWDDDDGYGWFVTIQGATIEECNSKINAIRIVVAEIFDKAIAKTTKEYLWNREKEQAKIQEHAHCGGNCSHNHVPPPKPIQNRVPDNNIWTTAPTSTPDRDVKPNVWSTIGPGNAPRPRPEPEPDRCSHCGAITSADVCPNGCESCMECGGLLDDNGRCPDCTEICEYCQRAIIDGECGCKICDGCDNKDPECTCEIYVPKSKEQLVAEAKPKTKPCIADVGDIWRTLI